MPHADVLFETLPPPSQPTRVLIVDDSRAQRHLMASTLRKANYDVVEASCAEEALVLCLDQSINVIVSDWGMPGMDGPEFCTAFRNLNRPYAYFILITSRADREERAKGLDSGADDFLTRPIDWVELRARIRAGERLIAMHQRLGDQKNFIEQTLSELQDLHSALQDDLAEARKLQQSLIPPPVWAFEDCTVASRLVTCGQIGGDLVGHFSLTDGKVAIYSIDVSGHGIASALMTGRLSGLFSNQQRDRNIAFSRGPNGEMVLDSPDKVMERLNQLMLQELDTDIYFTCALAYVDQTTGAVELCQAGHPHPILQRHNGGVEQLGRGGPPVGLVEGLDYEAIHFTLLPGDRLYLYSDGLSEAVDPRGNMLGENGLMDILDLTRGQDNYNALRDLEHHLRTFTGQKELDDDFSILSLEFRPNLVSKPRQVFHRRKAS